jgi:hypothetical protein
MKLTNMAQSKSALNKAEKIASPSISEDKYPYGLKLHLDHDSLKKLGVKSLHPAGTLVHIHAKARVASTEERKQSDGNTSRNMALQIEHLAMSARPNSALDAVDSGVQQANANSTD